MVGMVLPNESVVVDGPVRPDTPNVRSNCCACAALPHKKNKQDDATSNNSFFKFLSSVTRRNGPAATSPTRSVTTTAIILPASEECPDSDGIKLASLRVLVLLFYICNPAGGNVKIRLVGPALLF